MFLVWEDIILQEHQRFYWGQWQFFGDDRKLWDTTAADLSWNTEPTLQACG